MTPSTDKLVLGVIGVIVIIFLGIRGFYYWSHRNDSVPVCGITNCHGLDITCGPGIPQACTMQYEFGDGCRQFAKCEVIDNKCQPNHDPRFEACKNCINDCAERAEIKEVDMYACESECIDKSK